MPQRGHKIGIDANQPVSAQGRLADRLRDPSVIADTGAAWVRINFVLGPWADPRDNNWIRIYETIVNQYVQRGMNVYGLIGHESVKPDPGDLLRGSRDQTGHRSQAQAWIAKYVNNFGEIVTRFRDRVKYFESFNEPDDWHGKDRAWIHPTWFADILDQIYRKVQVELGFRDVQLISGPLQGLEINKNNAANYLRQTYQYGKQQFGWGRGNPPFPFDGVGYHIYIKEGYTPNWQSNWAQQERAVREMYQRFINEMKQVIKNAEKRDKLLYISEMGWFSHNNSQDEQAFQAKHVPLCLDLLNNDPSVSIGIWFCTEDFDSPHKTYGLYQQNNPTSQGRKPAYQAYKTFCDELLKEKPKEVVVDPVKPPTGGTGQSIQQQISSIFSQIVGLHHQFGMPTPTPLGGTIRQQITQLGDQVATLRPNETISLTGSLRQQLDYLSNQLSQVTSAPIKVDKKPITPVPGPITTPPSGRVPVQQQISDLFSQIVAKRSQADLDPPPALSGTIRQQIAQLRDQVAVLEPGTTITLSGSLMQQLAQLRAHLSGGVSTASTVQTKSTQTDRVPIRQQISDLFTQISAKRSQADLDPPPALSGTIRQQIAQLRDQVAVLEPGTTINLSGSLTQQLAQLQQYMGQTSTAATSSSSPSPTPTFTAVEVPEEEVDPSMEQALIELHKQIAELQQRLKNMSQSGQATTSQPAKPKPTVQTPPIQNIIPSLPRHATATYPTRNVQQIKQLIIHHTNINPAIGAARIAAHRVNRQNWPGIGYHYFITQEGQIQMTNELTVVARHTGSFDQESIGICLAGSFMQIPPNAAQIKATAQLCAWLVQQLNLSTQAVVGYKDIARTTDPGTTWDTGVRWGDQLKRDIQSLLG